MTAKRAAKRVSVTDHAFIQWPLRGSGPSQCCYSRGLNKFCLRREDEHEPRKRAKGGKK